MLFMSFMAGEAMAEPTKRAVKIVEAFMMTVLCEENLKIGRLVIDESVCC